MDVGTITSLQVLLALAEGWRASGLRVVFTNGCFDLLHRGHIELLREASKLGDVLIVGLNSDASVQRLKGPGRPIMTDRDRARVLCELRSVDFVHIFEADTPRDLVDALRPDVMVKGSDYHVQEIAGADIVLESGGKVVTLPLVAGYSTSALLKRALAASQIQEGD